MSAVLPPSLPAVPAGPGAKPAAPGQAGKAEAGNPFALLLAVLGAGVVPVAAPAPAPVAAPGAGGRLSRPHRLRHRPAATTPTSTDQRAGHGPARAVRSDPRRAGAPPAAVPGPPVNRG